MSAPRITTAVIGWSNWRSGTEFYEDTEATEGYARWLPRAVHDPDGKQPHGRLLTDALGDPEGARAIVIILPGRGANPEDALAKIRAALT